MRNFPVLGKLLRRIVEEGTDRQEKMILCESNRLSESNVTVSVSLKSNRYLANVFLRSLNGCNTPRKKTSKIGPLATKKVKIMH